MCHLVKRVKILVCFDINGMSPLSAEEAEGMNHQVL